MNKMLMNLPELMKELRMGEKILKEKKGVHMAMKDFSSSSSKKENKNKKNNTK